MRKAIYLSIFLWFARRLLRKARPVEREREYMPDLGYLPPSGTYGLFLVDREPPYYYIYGSRFAVPADRDSRLKLATVRKLVNTNYRSSKTGMPYSVIVGAAELSSDPMVREYPGWRRTLDEFERNDRVMTEAYSHVLDIIPSGWFLD